MNYFVILILGLVSFYLFTFARYNWKVKNKRAAFGLIILGLITFIYPAVMIVLRW
ncbi:MAG TPA: hypothetical protein PK733_05505 [Clostridiales bacterium]|nr:hypothetical protein [Clostridiales bacterium]